MMRRRELLLALAAAPVVPLVGCASRPKTPLAHLYGQDWVHGAYELYAKGYRDVQTSAETASFASYSVLAKKGIVALDGLQDRGVPFFVRVNAAARDFAIERDVPERLTFTAAMTPADRDEATASWNRAREHVHTDYEEIRRLDGSLTTLLGQQQRVRNAIEEGRIEQYRIVHQLQPLAEGQTPFELPYQVGASDYAAVLYLLLERLEDDRARLSALEGSMVAVGLVARSTDSNSGSLSANLRRVLVAVSDDAKATAPRDSVYPAAPSAREDLTRTGKDLATKIAASDAYVAWRKREDSKAFDQLGSLLATLDQLTGLPTSAIYRQVLDIWRGDADYLSYLRTVIGLVPGGGSLAAVLRDASAKTDKARDALSALATPSLDSVTSAAKQKGVGLLNTGSTYAVTRAKKQLVFFANEKEAAAAAESLRAAGLE